jgi:hypothetical protein
MGSKDRVFLQNTSVTSILLGYLASQMKKGVSSKVIRKFKGNIEKTSLQKPESLVMVSLQESVFSSFVSGYCTVEIWRECLRVL